MTCLDRSRSISVDLSRCSNRASVYLFHSVDQDADLLSFSLITPPTREVFISQSVGKDARRGGFFMEQAIEEAILAGENPPQRLSPGTSWHSSCSWGGGREEEDEVMRVGPSAPVPGTGLIGSDENPPFPLSGSGSTREAKFEVTPDSVGFQAGTIGPT